MSFCLSCKDETISYIDFYRSTSQFVLSIGLKDSTLIKKNLRDLLKLYPRNNNLPISETFFWKILYHAKKNNVEIDDVIKDLPVYYSDSISFITGLPIKYRTKIINKISGINKSLLKHKEEKLLSTYLDSLGVMDQHIFLEKSDPLYNLIPSFVKKLSKDTCEFSIDMDIYSKSLTEYLLFIYDKFGLLSSTNCHRCRSLETSLLHISNWTEYQRISHLVDKLFKQGYISTYSYAWIYDRNYNEKYHTYYYYWALPENPIYKTNFIPMDKLPNSTINMINLRRDSIGLPRLPAKFFLLDTAI